MAKASLRDLDYSVLQQCMHCGMCLPTCPTYLTSRKERHSPGGRIALMRAVADGRFEAGPELADEMNLRLGCFACTTACPAGVDHGTMFETARAGTEANHSSGGPLRRFYRWAGSGRNLSPSGPALGGWSLAPLLPAIRSCHRDPAFELPDLLGRRLGDLEPQAPPLESPFSDGRIAEIESPPPSVAVRGRVGMLSGVHPIAGVCLRESSHGGRALRRTVGKSVTAEAAILLRILARAHTAPRICPGPRPKPSWRGLILEHARRCHHQRRRLRFAPEALAPA